MLTESSHSESHGNSRSEEGRGTLIHGYAGGNRTAVEIPPISLHVHVPYRSRFTFFSAPSLIGNVVETLVDPLRENGDSLCQIAGIPEWRVISRLEIGTRETSWRDNIIVEHDGLRIL